MVRRGRRHPALIPKSPRARCIPPGIPRTSARYSTLRILGRMWSTTRHDLPCLPSGRSLVQLRPGVLADEHRRVASRVCVA